MWEKMVLTTLRRDYYLSTTSKLQDNKQQVLVKTGVLMVKHIQITEHLNNKISFARYLDAQE